MRAFWLAVAVSLLWIPRTGHAASLRCGTALVADGASKSEVVAKCGEPVSKESRAESEEVKTRDGDTSTKRVVQKTFEECMQVVLFENGKLVDVKSAGYGR